MVQIGLVSNLYLTSDATIPLAETDEQMTG
jgi:hypothetical protein